MLLRAVASRSYPQAGDDDAVHTVLLRVFIGRRLTVAYAQSGFPILLHGVCEKFTDVTYPSV